jgi:hypothetical protein
MKVEVGDIRRFNRYEHLLPDVPEVFSQGMPLAVIEVEPDGVVRCAVADYDGGPVHQVTDMLFVEELTPV